MTTIFYEFQVDRIHLVGILAGPVVKDRQPGNGVGPIHDVAAGAGGDADVG